MSTPVPHQPHDGHGHENKQQLADVKTTDTTIRYIGYTSRILLTLKRGIRYAAYTSDVGEALRYIIGKRAVQMAYLISWLYVAGDVAYETYKKKQEGVDKNELYRTALSRALFQSLASMILPAITIHEGVKYSAKGFEKIGKYQKWGPTMVGFCIIPFLPFMFDHPVEHGVDYLFDRVWPHQLEAKKEEL